ncbi:MAG TPA: sigma-70 family RNA polymerase sigma factor [Gemmatimonadales bacterium]|nr:sigma-70 family RNA polymerase sigma factor [Gemmatimonadales bacterium]
MRTSPVTEAELAAQARAGSSEAFGALVERHAERARRVARAALLDPHDADDAVQDALYSAWRALDRFDPARPFGPWFLRIVVNAAADLRRRRKLRQTEEVPESAPDSRAGPDRDLDRALLREALDRALATLPERRRMALVLHDAEGYVHEEIAVMLDVPVGTVRSDVFHARRAMRAALAPTGGNDK